ncbi:MAG: hypothetical protein QM773_06740 [Hyphomonadaceae bacterium]
MQKDASSSASRCTLASFVSVMGPWMGEVADGEAFTEALASARGTIRAVHEITSIAHPVMARSVDRRMAASLDLVMEEPQVGQD